MKVRCIKLLDWTGQPVERASWMKVGGVYTVLALWIEPGHNRFRLVGEEWTPGLFDAEMFELVSGIVPSVWTISSPQPGCFSIEPEAWSRPGFWDAFFDREPEAIAVFEEERRKILAADP
jgi:hypothetical protein